MVTRRNAALSVAATILVLAALAPLARTQQKTLDVSGNWKWSFEGFGGNQVDVTLKLKQDGDKLTGTITGFNGEDMNIEDGKVKGDEVSFKTVRDFNGQKVTTIYTGKQDGDSLKGKSDTIFSRDFEAKRGQ
jgi:hypothetical protein